MAISISLVSVGTLPLPYQDPYFAFFISKFKSYSDLVIMNRFSSVRFRLNHLRANISGALRLCFPKLFRPPEYDPLASSMESSEFSDFGDDGLPPHFPDNWDHQSFRPKPLPRLVSE